MDQHGGGLPVVGCVRHVDRVRGEKLGMRKELRGKGLQRLHVGAHVVEQIVGDVSLQGGGLRHGGVQHGIHRLLGDLRDALLLLRAGFRHHLRKSPLHLIGHGGIYADQQQDKHQHQIKDLLLQPAYFDSFDDFHFPFLISFSFFSIIP